MSKYGAAITRDSASVRAAIQASASASGVDTLAMPPASRAEE